MQSKRALIAILALALVSMACGINVRLPEREIKTGPVQTEDISIPAPDSPSADVTLAFGAGELTLAPGAEDALISGQAVFNVNDLRPIIDTRSNNVELRTGDLEVRGIPNFKDNIRNEWDLKLSEMPMNLKISAGAYQADMELGGLSLQSLEVGDGAADVSLRFSEPNLVEMESLRYETGASNVRLYGLANANFTEMAFRSGAGDYTLDFSGELQRDAEVTIESGISRVIIIVSEDASVEVIFEGALTNVDTDGDWDRSGKTYSLNGSGPTLTIRVNMGAGNLELRAR